MRPAARSPERSSISPTCPTRGTSAICARRRPSRPGRDPAGSRGPRTPRAPPLHRRAGRPRGALSPAAAPFRIAVATLALVAIGAVESLVSARSLAEQVGRGRPALAPAGSLLTLVGLVLSIGVYLGLGRLIARAGGTERRAAVEGVATGLVARALGGTIRALAGSDYLRAPVARFGLPGALLLPAPRGVLVPSV